MPFKWQNNAYNSAAATSASVTLGGNTITVGDCLIIVVAVYGAGAPGVDPGTISPPSGWTVMTPGTMTGNSFCTPSDGSGVRTALFQRTADGTEGSSFTFGWTTSAIYSWAILSYDAATLDGGAETDHNSTYTSTFTAPAITTANASDTEVAVFTAIIGGTFTMPSGTTSRVNQAGSTSTSPWIGIGDISIPTAGSQAALSGTYQFSTDGWQAFAFGLTPTGGGGGGGGFVPYNPWPQIGPLVAQKRRKLGWTPFFDPRRRVRRPSRGLILPRRQLILPRKAA